MKWLKLENDKLKSPPVYDKETGMSNCHVNTEWLISHGYTQWTEDQERDWYESKYPSTIKNTTAFDTACEYFRQICGEIGFMIGDDNFKGGYDDMPIFYAHESYKTDRGMQLAIAWSGCNDLCKYEASKLGIGSPEWWYRCWSSSNTI